MSTSKENKKLIRLGILYAIILVFVAYIIPKQHNWTPSFSKDYNWPFGGEIIFDQLSQIFGEDEPLVVDNTYYQQWRDTSFTNHNLIIINRDFYPDSLDLDQVFRFVREGNQAFIASEGISYLLLDSLGLEMDSDFNAAFSNISEGKDALLGLNFSTEIFKADSTFKFKSPRYYNYFIKSDSLKEHYQLGSIHESDVAFVRVPYGAGNFYLHSFPTAFTNYHILKDNLYTYISTCFSHLPKQKLIWDEYYKLTREMEKSSPLAVLLEHKSFKWAYWIGLITLALFIIFYAKRKQRIIPVIKPYKNESLDFTKTISSLYFQRKENRDLALKKINYFREYISSTYHLKGLKFNEDDAKTLSYKSEFEYELIQKLFKQIRNIQGNTTTSDGQLKVLTENMNKIYKRQKIIK